MLYTDVVDEPAGFHAYVDAHSRALLRAGWLLTGDWSSAEDLVQTALAAAWPRWASLATPDAYVRRVMTTTYLRWQRRRWTGEIPTADAGSRGGPSENQATPTSVAPICSISSRLDRPDHQRRPTTDPTPVA
ncbi:MAG TPA: sigma factor [Jatrophihabitantaceae bacterium]|nr:sigma factor [Jatrophihabitantaceae bacterium]